eukprot:9508931-Alexandrium_andersonii.AAC.1
MHVDSVLPSLDPWAQFTTEQKWAYSRMSLLARELPTISAKQCFAVRVGDSGLEKGDYVYVCADKNYSVCWMCACMVDDRRCSIANQICDDPDDDL